MKKDINPTKVEDVALAVVLEENELGEDVWSAYIINMRDHDLDTVLIRSNGYSEEQKTSELRHFFESIKARSFKKVEMLLPEALTLTNQFWLSFVLNNEILDKKYVFVSGSIQKKNLVQVPLLDKKGVVIL